MSKYKAFSPENIGCLDAVQTTTPSPSPVYSDNRKIIRYLDGYLGCCTITIQPRNWHLAADLLRLYSPEQMQAEIDAAYLEGELWQLTIDELQADALAVDEAQSEQSDWRWA